MKRANILVVDDDIFFQKAIADTLSQEGFNVFTAGTIPEAKGLFNKNYIDVVILDLVLKEGSGIDFLPWFLRDGARVIVLTGHASMDTAITALKMGASDYLRKPVEPGRLIASIDCILQRREDSRVSDSVEALRAKLERLELLDLISRAISSTTQTCTLFKMSLGITMGFIGADGASLFLRDEKTGELTCYMASGTKGALVEGQRTPMGKGIVGWVAEHGEPVLANDISRDPRFSPEMDAKTGYKTRSILAVPLRSKGKVSGVLEVVNKKNNENFTMDDQNLLFSLANHLAIAVENASITEELRVARDMLEDKVRERTKELEKAIEELKRVQSQLIQSEKMASLGVMAAGVAHEINNPLSFIQSNLLIIKDYFKEGLLRKSSGQVAQEEDIVQAIDESLEGTRRITDIVKGLKEFARQDEGKSESFSINSLIESILSMLANELKYKVEIVREFSNVPEIFANKNQIAQVMVNLTMNAVQAIEKRGKIFYRTSSDGKSVSIEVEDTGCGISEKNLQRIFDPFFTTKPVGKGTGLGLSIVMGIIQNHGGEIRVESEVNRGTRFIVSLPVKSSTENINGGKRNVTA